VDRQSAVQRLVNADMAEKQANEVVAMMADQIDTLQERGDARLEQVMSRFREDNVRLIKEFELSSERSKASFETAIREAISDLRIDVRQNLMGFLWRVMGFITVVIVATAGLAAAVGHYFK
jgi:hypothetical protein